MTDREGRISGEWLRDQSESFKANEWNTYHGSLEHKNLIVQSDFDYGTLIRQIIKERARSAKLVEALKQSYQPIRGCRICKDNHKILIQALEEYDKGME